MWVRLPDWMIADGEPPAPAVGSTLEHIGVRLYADTQPADDAPDGIRESVRLPPDEVRYKVTGVVEAAHDFQSDEGSGPRHAGCEIVVAVEGLRLQVMTPGHAHRWPERSRVTASGRFELVGEYEWDGFVMVDTRSSWFVKAVERAGNDDLMLDLHASGDRDRLRITEARSLLARLSGPALYPDDASAAEQDDWMAWTEAASWYAGMLQAAINHGRTNPEHLKTGRTLRSEATTSVERSRRPWAVLDRADALLESLLQA